VKQWGLDDYVIFKNTWIEAEYFEWCTDNCSCMLGVFGESRKAYTVVPNKVVDALAFGIPCITGISTGIKEFFDGKEDVICVEHTPEALATAIEHLMSESYIEISERVARLKDRYEKNFSEDKFEKEMAIIFASKRTKQ
jgi:glycosyltransferase involved in cell wall biosynthesis